MIARMLLMHSIFNSRRNTAGTYSEQMAHRLESKRKTAVLANRQIYFVEHRDWLLVALEPAEKSSEIDHNTLLRSTSESEDPTLTRNPRDEANQVMKQKLNIQNIGRQFEASSLHVPCQPITPENVHEFVHVGSNAPQQR